MSKLPAFFIAPIATGLVLFGGTAVAQATEVTSQSTSEVDAMETDRTGTSAAAVEEGTVRNDGNIEMPRVAHSWRKVGPVDALGQPTWVWVPIDYSGVPSATILHN